MPAQLRLELTDEEAAQLDLVKGPATRTAYAQDLIRRALSGDGASPGDGGDLRAVLREELDTALYGEMFETRLTRIVRQEIQRAAGMG